VLGYQLVLAIVSWLIYSCTIKPLKKIRLHWRVSRKFIKIIIGCICVARIRHCECWEHSEFQLHSTLKPGIWFSNFRRKKRKSNYRTTCTLKKQDKDWIETSEILLYRKNTLSEMFFKPIYASLSLRELELCIQQRLWTRPFNITHSQLARVSP
jgi:hypothetical protein